jgi:hypothetical protein
MSSPRTHLNVAAKKPLSPHIQNKKQQHAPGPSFVDGDSGKFAVSTSSTLLPHNFVLRFRCIAVSPPSPPMRDVRSMYRFLSCATSRIDFLAFTFALSVVGGGGGAGASV